MQKRKYFKVPDEVRIELIRILHKENITIFEAARRLNIPYYNAKAIHRVWNNENRLEKHKKRKREKKYEHKNCKNSEDL